MSRKAPRRRDSSGCKVTPQQSLERPPELLCSQGPLAEISLSRLSKSPLVSVKRVATLLILSRWLLRPGGPGNRNRVIGPGRTGPPNWDSRSRSGPRSNRRRGGRENNRRRARTRSRTRARARPRPPGQPVTQHADDRKQQEDFQNSIPQPARIHASYVRYHHRSGQPTRLPGSGNS